MTDRPTTEEMIANLLLASAACVQAADTIEALRVKVAALEAENKRLDDNNAYLADAAAMLRGE